MKWKMSVCILCLFACSGSAAQEAFARNSDLDRIAEDVSSRIDFDVSKSDANGEGVVRDLLSKPLTEVSAVRIALLNNPSLQATLESYGIAKADFNKMRLPGNPTFGVSVRFPREDEPYNQTEFSIEQDFLSLVLFPLKSSVASAELDQAELSITKRVLDLAFEAKTAFYEAEGAATMFAMWTRTLEQAGAAQELAKRQFEAGNINELNYSLQKSIYQDAWLEYLKAEAELRLKNEDLNRLMGFGGEKITWTVRGELEEVQLAEPSLEDLQFQGMNNSLEYLIARKRVDALRHGLSLSRWDILGHPEIGVSTEKDVEGGRVTGPSLRTELPIYDLGQTEVMRSRSQLKEAELGLKALEGEIRSGVKQGYDRLQVARSLVEEYRNSVIPLREKITRETLKHYNYMLVGNFDLIRAKQEEIIGHQQYVESLKDYWIARADLEKVLSSKLPLGPAYDKKDHASTAPAAGGAHQHGGSHV
jgi:cobalt-zinc-cadmium efflux system outer membrane protein